MNGILKKYDLSKSFNLLDIFIFIYISSLISHKLGYGFDAIYCRITFIILVVFFLLKILIDYFNGKSIKIFGKYFIWSILFWFYAFISAIWSLNIDFVLSFNWNITIQCIIIPIIFFYRIKNVDDLMKIFKIIIVSIAYMCTLVLLRCPINELGKERMGEAVGIHANAFGRNIAFGIIISIYVFLTTHNYKYIVIIIFFGINLLLSGSRSAMLMVAFAVLFYILFFLKKQKRFLYFILFILIGIIGVYWILKNETMYNLIGWRIKGILHFFSANIEMDASTNERLFFINTAKKLFYEHPIFGAGLNNFKYYLESINYSHITYSHCNHWEMLSCLGIIGHLIYYSIHYTIILKCMCNIKKMNNTKKIALCIVTIMLVIDYSIISYMDIFYQLILNLCWIAFLVGNRTEGRLDILTHNGG